MSELDKLLAWGDLPVPEVLRQLPHQQQQEVATWAINIISNKTEGLDDLYNAISMIVKYIPNFMVVPLMVEHIRPRIAAEVCIKMGVDQATGYANDLPLEYFSAVSKHLDATMMAQILEKMKKNTVEKFIHYELKNYQSRVLDIATHVDRRILQIVAKLVTLPEPSTVPGNNPHEAVIEKIRAMQ
jgi:pentose-5-phosphate-3-epimerase